MQTRGVKAQQLSLHDSGRCGRGHEVENCCYPSLFAAPRHNAMLLMRGGGARAVRNIDSVNAGCLQNPGPSTSLRSRALGARFQLSRHKLSSSQFLAPVGSCAMAAGMLIALWPPLPEAHRACFVIGHSAAAVHA